MAPPPLQPLRVSSMITMPTQGDAAHVVVRLNGISEVELSTYLNVAVKSKELATYDVVGASDAPTGDSLDLATIIIASCGGVLVLLAASLGCCYWYRKKQEARNGSISERGVVVHNIDPPDEAMANAPAQGGNAPHPAHAGVGSLDEAGGVELGVEGMVAALPPHMGVQASLPSPARLPSPTLDTAVSTRIQEFKELLDAGVLTQEEFERCVGCG